MDTLTRMRAFIDVVEAEGFSAAARKTGRSKALLSKYVRELEDDLLLSSFDVNWGSSRLACQVDVTPEMDGMEVRYPGMVDASKLTQTPLGRALERSLAVIEPKKFTNLTKAKITKLMVDAEILHLFTEAGRDQEKLAAARTRMAEMLRAGKMPGTRAESRFWSSIMQYADGGSCAPRPITWNERDSWRCALSETTSLSLSSLSFGPSAMSAS